MKIVFLLFVAAGSVVLLGCASTGQLTFKGKQYRLNESDVKREEDGRYRVWAWRLGVWGTERSVGGAVAQVIRSSFR